MQSKTRLIMQMIIISLMRNLLNNFNNTKIRMQDKPQIISAQENYHRSQQLPLIMLDATQIIQAHFKTL